MKKFNDENFYDEIKSYSLNHQEDLDRISRGERFYHFNLGGNNFTSEDPHIQNLLNRIMEELLDMEKEGEMEKDEWKENFLEVGYWGDEYGNIIKIEGIGFISGLDQDFHITHPIPLYQILPIKLIPLPLEEGLHLLPIE